MPPSLIGTDDNYIVCFILNNSPCSTSLCGFSLQKIIFSLAEYEIQLLFPGRPIEVPQCSSDVVATLSHVTAMRKL